MNNRPPLRWRLKNDAYQVLLDGLKWRRLRLERAAERTNKAYCGVIQRAIGHFKADRGVFLLIIGIVVAHVVVFFWGVRDYFRRRR